MGTKKRKSLKSLAAGRPPMARSARSMSSKASRTLINNHHQLQKMRFQAAANGDKDLEAAISTEIASLGGLNQYQQASLHGQSIERGGDTSKILLKWLSADELAGLGRRPSMLEVGSLSTRNACSTCGLFDVVHIDLNSQEPNILQQDFMARPLPESEADKFDVISLSLVLNFVPDAMNRGQMLLRTLSFLRDSGKPSRDTAGGLPFPLLFLVLPRSCLDNSRYMTAGKLEELMGTLGYELVKAKSTQKLAYGLWGKARPLPSAAIEFTKREINPGRTRNNFSITLKHPPTQST
ncbi:hypothetical protein DCS_03041 [Drechmeria coniospora]|uniref:25S rRNA adenine-N(1) methyltransferase n=1 Tax=Drechmeria coniospora TaxID=98403 RepID=A0A151GXS5_DRECN|nr:hypothetical protein DCS_03041 [Drechmeria coniospora]KYK61896.1 hypothetical protein DCS_03041 [Drechmeria coniospora]ODA82707.1 hypothetical protein RJ55_01216 [Drechmeria coniospora]